MEDVYRLLLRNKMKNESFSDTIRRVLTKNRDILEFAGAWRNITERESEEMKINIRDLRKRATKELRYL